MPRKPYRAPARWYDAENERHAVLRQDVPFFLGQLPTRRQSILELACGTGRAAIPMARAGHGVVGVDYAPEMIEIALQKRDAAELTEKQLTLSVGDMLDLNLRQRFDWVCIFFNTFCNFTTLELQDRVIQTVVRHLKPKGRFWLDVFNPDHGLLAQTLAMRCDPYSFYVPEERLTVFFSTDVRRARQPQLQHVVHRYEWFDERGRRHKSTHAFDMTFFHPRELQMLMERHGLAVEHIWGNYDGSAVTPESPRIILRCCRR